MQRVPAGRLPGCYVLLFSPLLSVGRMMIQALKRLPAIALALAVLLATCHTALAGSQSDDGWIDDDQINVRSQLDQAGNIKDEAAHKAAGSPVMLKGGVTYCVPSGTPIKLKLASVPSFGMRALQRDLDGNLIPAEVDEKISAKVTEDIYVDDEKVIPAGTIFYGKVSKIFPPKHVGRPGSLAISFGAFETPDGRKFAFRAEANNTRKSTTKSKLKGAGIIAAHMGGGAVVGALIAYQIFGLQETIAMHGYNIAGGAAAGALMGLGVALWRKGPRAVLEPGDDLNMDIDQDLLIPAATAPTVKAPLPKIPGLDIRILKTKLVKDGIDGNLLRINAQIDNNSNHRLQSIDLFVEDDNGERYPVVPDMHEEHSDMLFTVNPYSSRFVSCDFALEYPKLKRRLIWLDHDSRQVIIEEPLP
ncbi:MAG TPA: hypothetical protein V6D22_10935 [Candidatus Obscuribacterales bacterium]